MRHTRPAALLAGAVLAVGATAPAVAAPPDRTSIVDVALAVNAETGEFDQLIAAATELGLVDLLDANRQLTVFAPTDAAFEELYEVVGVDGLDGLVATLGPDAVAEVVSYHVAPGRRTSTSVAGASQVNTLQGEKIPVRVDGGTVQLDEATLVQADVAADNGVVHVIDAVMLPAAFS